MTARRFAMTLGVSALGALTLGASSSLAFGDDNRAQGQHYHSGDPKKLENALVKAVRQATARYRDVRIAEADNYGLAFGCVSDDWGAMGLHYVNMELVGDGKLDVSRPEIIIYEPMPNGGRRLIGADYLIFAKDWDVKKNGGPPQVGGQLMHYFPSPNRFGLEAFYTLHVWAWKNNPTGAFVNWHTNVSCDAFGTQPD
jgi:hypothetical protein